MVVPLCRRTRQIVAYVLGPRDDATARQLHVCIPTAYRQGLLYTDPLGSYHNVLPSTQHHATSAKGPTNRIERFNNTVHRRVGRLVRKTLSFSKCFHRHELVIRLFLHRYNLEFHNITKMSHYQI